MSRTTQTRAYRQRIYDKYVSEKVKAEGVNYAERDYQRWSQAAKVRLRGWLPADRNTPVLDMGCGAGHFLYFMAQLGYTNLTGVDLSPEQVALAQKWCPQAMIIQGDVREVLARNPNHYGLIAGFDIIEHFGKDEILPFLELVAKAMKPGGRLILQTPNAESPWYGAVAYGDFTHEWFFTPASLQQLLRQVGLTGFEARPSAPYIHGIKSLGRVVLWKTLNVLLALWTIAESGSRGSGIYTRVFVATAVKQ
jgi:2-polyprenyl-3-methyl-5-hydroxy-6-metoxy-1,4-benzoquinol methylase